MNGRTAATLHAQRQRLTGTRDLATVRHGGSRGLRSALVLTDLICCFVGWIGVEGLLETTTTMTSGTARPIVVVVTPVITVLVIAYNKLYQARQCAIRARETAALFRSCMYGGVALWIIASRYRDLDLRIESLIAGQTASFALVLLGRAGYRALLLRARKFGKIRRKVVLVGTGDEAKELEDLFNRDLGLGYLAVGVVGDRAEAKQQGFLAPYYGTLLEAAKAARELGASGAVIAATSSSMSQRNEVIRLLLEAEVHVQISGGLIGLPSNRVSANPISPSWAAFHLEPERERFRRAS